MTVGSVGDPKQLRRTFVDKTDKSLKQEPLRVVYGIPSTYNAIFSRSVCKRALQIIRQEPSRTSESFPQKLSPKNLEDDIFNLFMKGPLKKMSGSSQKDSTTSTISRPTSSRKGFQENITARFLSLHLWRSLKCGRDPHEVGTTVMQQSIQLLTIATHISISCLTAQIWDTHVSACIQWSCNSIYIQHKVSMFLSFGFSTCLLCYFLLFSCFYLFIFLSVDLSTYTKIKIRTISI